MSVTPPRSLGAVLEVDRALLGLAGCTPGGVLPLLPDEAKAGGCPTALAHPVDDVHGALGLPGALLAPS